MFNFFKRKKPRVQTPEVPSIQEDYTDIELIAKYFQDETGITFDRQMSILNNKVITFCKQKKIYSFKELLKKLQLIPELKQEIIDYLTTNETYFYREFSQIQELVQLIKSSGLHVKILCAPSATGEEAYSIAIALLEAGIASNSINIMGIDINQEAVIKAERAIYAERNIRNLSPSILYTYFTKKDDKYILKESIKELVTFKLANIFTASFKNLGKFDFVFSRNMLIYFDQPTKQKAKKILEDMRKDTQHSVFFGHADLF